MIMLALSISEIQHENFPDQRLIQASDAGVSR